MTAGETFKIKVKKPSALNRLNDHQNTPFSSFLKIATANKFQACARLFGICFKESKNKINGLMFNMLHASFHGFEYLFRHNYKQTSYVLAFPCYPAKNV